jgi:hypothetical protein
MLIKEEVSKTEEKRIVVGLILSTDFFKRIYSTLKLDYFTNSYLQTIASYCLTFYESYQKAPFNHIHDIFRDEYNANRIHETEAELIDTLLKSLAETYSEDDINVDYWVEMATDYFRSREMEILINNISVLKEKGDLEEAEKQINDYYRIPYPIEEEEILLNPADIETQERIYRKRDEEEANFFQIPGDLGKYLGNWKRGDVISFFGPAKRGKTRTLLSMYKYGVLSKKKTLFFSIEMVDTEVLPLTNQVFFPMVDDEPGMYKFPVFDCEFNQTGLCSERLSNTTVQFEKIENDEKEKGKKTIKKPIYDPGHTVCTKCRNHPNLEIRKKFKIATFWEEIYRDKNDIFTVRKNIQKFQKSWQKYGRLSVHKKYTLTYDKLMRDIDIFWQRQSWFPDILIIDYVDILGINSKFDDYRLVDEQWKLLAKLAGETNTLVITATQGNLAAHKTDQLDSSNQGGWYGKNRHVNMMIGLNQNAVEKDLGLMRYGITEARLMPFIPGQNCVVLSDFVSGQSYIDSYYPYSKANH